MFISVLRTQAGRGACIFEIIALYSIEYGQFDDHLLFAPPFAALLLLLTAAAAFCFKPIHRKEKGS